MTCRVTNTLGAASRNGERQHCKRPEDRLQCGASSPHHSHFYLAAVTLSATAACAISFATGSGRDTYSA
jgi:hypothetical protein